MRLQTPRTKRGSVLLLHSHPMRGESLEKSNKMMRSHRTEEKNNNAMPSYEPLIDTRPLGGGGAKPSHNTPEGREPLRKNADCGNTNAKPVMDSRLALLMTLWTGPPHAGVQLRAPAPIWREQTSHMRFLFLTNCRSLAQKLPFGKP